MFSQKTVCIVTGASQGLGKSIALNFSAKFPADSLLILLSRNETALSEVKQLVAPGISCVAHSFDQSTVSDQYYSAVLSDCLTEAKFKSEDFDQAVIVHNAGSLECEMTKDWTDVKRVSNYFNVNVAGVIALNAQFLQIFENIESKYIIGISSLGAIKPIPSWSLYCSAKAARDMYFQTVASEYPTIRVLNYAPGPLQTNMFDEIVLKETKHQETLKMFHGIKSSVLSCATTVGKLMDILTKNTYENGAHIDYYDEI